MIKAPVKEMLNLPRRYRRVSGGRKCNGLVGRFVERDVQSIRDLGRPLLPFLDECTWTIFSRSVDARISDQVCQKCCLLEALLRGSDIEWSQLDESIHANYFKHSHIGLITDLQLLDAL